MTDDRAIGRLEAKVDLLISDVSAIRAEMVTRREFNDKVAEHAQFKKEIDELKAVSHKSELLRRIGEKLLWGGVGSALLMIGIKL
jgi:hypothetical protein